MNRWKRFIKHRNVVVEESIYCNKIWQVFGHVDSFFSNHSTRDVMSTNAISRIICDQASTNYSMVVLCLGRVQ